MEVNKFSTTGDTNQPAANTEDVAIETSTFKNEFKKTSMKKGDWVRLLMSFAISWAVFYLFRNIIFHGIPWYWVRSILALALAFMALGAVRLAMEGPSLISAPLTVWIFFWFSLGLILTYLVPEKNNKKTTTEVVAPPVVEVKTAVPELAVRTLDPGAYNFSMEAGQETGWFNFPDGGMFNYNVSSPGDQWQIQYADESSPLDGWTLKSFPKKQHPTFKIISKNKQVVTIKVTKG